jgi:hypothetical protein
MRFAFFFLACGMAYGQAGTGILSVTIREKSTGETVPAMVCITSTTDGTWRVPPDGTIVSPTPVTGNQQIAGWAAGPNQWMPDQPGPVRLVKNLPIPGVTMEMRQGGSYVAYAGLPALPYWEEPVAYFVPKPFTITLPPGKWRLAVAHGTEHLPVFEEITIAAGEKVQRTVELVRWIDMPKQGWYSGDPEFHDWRDKPWRNEFILAWARAQDIHMTSILSYSATPTNIGHPQMGYGKDFRYQKGDYALASGHEGPRPGPTDQGHLMSLNTTSVVRDIERDHLMDYVCDGVHKQGGLCGYAHLAWSEGQAKGKTQEMHPGWDSAINIIRQKIDFLEILQFRQLGTETYYDFLNMGVRLTALAASDVTGGDTLGESVTYAHTGPKFSPDAWYAAVRDGHTFVTNGPMLMLTAGGGGPGDSVDVRKNAKVRITVLASAPPEMGVPELLEVISHGKVIKTVESKNARESELKADFEIPVTESQWIAARVKSRKSAIAHTSPVYLIVNGESFADRAQLPQLVARQMAILDFIEKRLRNPQFVERSHYTEAELPVLFAAVKEARARYQAILAAGGESPTPRGHSVTPH